MDIITEQYDSISLNQLYTQLSLKQRELAKIDEKIETEAIEKKDYIELSTLGKNYDEEDLARVLSKFRNKDLEVRTHEQAHATIAHTTSPIAYNYQEGPDGKMYAVGGSVRFDTSIPEDPKSAIFKMEMLQKAASAPVETSAADNTIAAQSNLNKMLLHMQGENDANK